jgi:ribosome-binding factor A
MSHRIPRVNELLVREVSRLLQREIDLNTESLVTVKKADATDDLKEAKIWVSIFPEQHVAEVFAQLQSRTGEVQHHLNRRLEMKFVPAIKFYLDESDAKAAHIHGLIREAKQEDGGKV